MATTMYAVEGMMCESCLAAVLENVYSLSGVSVAALDLVAGGQSPLIVTSGTQLGADAVRHAVEHVGFGVVPPRDRGLRDRGDTALPPGTSQQIQIVKPHVFHGGVTS